MADFLTDYSNLSGAGAAFQGFAKGYEDSQDNKMKRQEMQARMDAQKAQMDREADQTAIQARLAGLQKTGPGQFGEAPLSPKERAANKLKAFGEGAEETGADENGNATGFKINPNTPAVIKAKTGQQKAQDATDYRGKSLDLRNDVVDRREHQTVINKINSNPNVKTRLQQYQNLDNTLSNIANADHITPEMFDEAQQAVRANLGIKGTSGVDERSHTQMNALGLNTERWGEFLSFKPGDIGKDNAFLGHIKNLANLEKQNISNQFDKSLNAASAGHASMYGRRQIGRAHV